jgi:hypothetical protein
MHSEPLVANGTLPTFRRRVLRPFPCHGVFEIVSVLAECVSLLCCQKCFPILTQMILVRLRNRDLVLYLSTTAGISLEMLPPMSHAMRSTFYRAVRGCCAKVGILTMEASAQKTTERYPRSDHINPLNYLFSKKCSIR